jgi:ABC-type phosphate transport system auxiliary subunit
METVQEINKRILDLQRQSAKVGAVAVQERDAEIAKNQSEIERLAKEKKRIQREAVESDPALLAAEKALADFNAREGTLINRRRNLEKERTRLHVQRGKDFLFSRPTKKTTGEIEKLEIELVILSESFTVYEDVKRELNNNILGARVRAERRVYRE